jgi:hypothetical protein
MLEAMPLLAARLAFHEHDPVLTRWLLDRVDIQTLATPDRQAWFELLTAIASPSQVLEAMNDRRRLGRLPRDLMARYARLAAELGHEVEYRGALADLRRVD